MAIVSKNSNNWSLSLKVLLFSTAVLTMAILLKLSVPVAVQFMVSAVPGLWSTLLLWLTPPYLYVVINGIIITIAASSRYHHKSEEKHSDLVAPVKVPVDPRSDFAISLALDETLMLKNQEYERPDFGSVLGFDSIAIKSPAETRPEFGGVAGYESVVMKSPEPAVTLPDFGGVVSYESVVTKHSPAKVQPDFEILDRNLHGKEESKVKEVKNTSSVTAASDRDFDDFVINRSAWTPIRRETKEILVEKPPASVRFGHRKPVKASPEAGKTLGVSKPKRHDTLESTWKTITDGRPIPLARHLKKSDTWERESHGRHNNNNNSGAQDKFALKMKKSETFNERNNKDQVASSPSPSPGSGKLKKEPSLSQDELNRRVEAFIKKFNEEMRLQRQESLNQYKEMVQRAGH